MKIYIVADGYYSDYHIERVFSNKEAAEEYRYWHNIENEIEEYEVADTASCTAGKRYWYIKVSGIVYPEAVVDLRYEIHPVTILDTQAKGDVRIDIWEYKYKNTLKMYNYHYVPAENWNEELYKEKYTKVLYDQAAMIKYLLADGTDLETAEKILRKGVE